MKFYKLYIKVKHWGEDYDIKKEYYHNYRSDNYIIFTR